MRMFVAIRPSTQAVADLEGFLEPRLSAQSAPRWAAPQQWHVTMAFMADIAQQRVEDLDAALGDVAAQSAPIRLRVRGGGVFPDALSARVLWAGIESEPPDGSASIPQLAPGTSPAGAAEVRVGVDPLDRLAQRVRHAAGAAGADPAGGRFVPHLTLGRFPRAANAVRWLELLQAYAGPPWVAEEVLLIASYLLDRSGGHARHEVLGRHRLARS